MDERKIIVTDAGHGGTDVGAPNGNRYEKNDNFIYEPKLNASLIRCGFNALSTRTSDKYMSLQERSDFANKIKADLFISCHRNAFTNSTAHGVEVCVYDKLKTTSSTYKIANAIQSELVKVGVSADRGISPQNFHVLRETNMPAVLIELGFITNAQDNNLFDTKVDEYVEAITKAVCSYFGVAYVPPVVEKPVAKPVGVLYCVQVGAYSDKSNADKLAKELEEKGYKPYISTKKV